MRRVISAAAVLSCSTILSAACIPPRNNEHDPAGAPAVSLRVLADGLPVASTERRADGLLIEVRVADPQKEPVTVTLTMSDPRTEQASASLGCTSFEPQTVGTVVTSSSATLAWAVFPPAPCFEAIGSAEEGVRFTQPVTLSARAIDPRGNLGFAETSAVLVNARPVGDAGPALWVDPTFTTTGRLDATRSVDRDTAFDPAGSLTYQWRQISGPATLTLPPLGSFDVDLGPVAGTIYTVEMTVCDPWECGEPVQLDVHKRPAMWVRAHDGVVLLDAGWAEATKFHEPAAGAAGNAGVDLPVASEVAGARAAAWIVSQGNTSVRSLASDLILRRVSMPSGYQTENTAAVGGARSIVLGGAPERDIVWVRAHLAANTASYAITEIARPDPLGPATATNLPGLGTTAPGFLTTAAQRDAGSPLWLAGRNFADSAYTVYQVDGTSSAPSFTFALPAPCAPANGNNIEVMDVADDGTLWILIERALVHVDAEAQAVLGCEYLPTDSFSPSDVEWIDIDDTGDGELLIGFNGDDRVFRSYGGAVGPGPNTPVIHRGIAFDGLRNRVVTATSFGMESWKPGEYGSPESFLAVQEAFAGAFQLGPFAMDYLGRPWVITSYYFSDPVQSRAIRVSPSLSLFRAHHRAEALGVSFVDDRLASVDRASGRIWVARPSAGGGWEAAPFDESGAVPNLAPVPLPGVPIELVHDAGTATRAGGFWVTTNVSGATAVLRIDLSGAVVASFGDGASLPPVMANAPPARQALDPASGALWATLNQTGFLDDGAVRFALDGTFLRVAPGSATAANNVNAPGDPRGVVDAAGDYWFGNAFFSGTPQANLVRTRPNGTVQAISVAASCTSGTVLPPEVVAFDATANHIVTLCKDASGPIAIVTRHSFTASTITALSTTTTNAPAPPDAEQVGIVSPVDGTIWAPQEAGVLLLDRYGNFVAERALPVQVSVPIRH